MSDTGHVINVWDKGNYFAIWEKEKYAEFGEHALAMLQKVDDLNALRKKSTASGQKLVDFCKDYALSSEPVTHQNYLNFIENLSIKYSHLMRDNMCYWLFAPNIIEKRIQALLSKYPEDQKKDIIQAHSHPAELSYSQRIEKEFSKLVASAREEGLESVSLRKKIEAFSSNYFWFPYEYVGPNIWDAASITERIKTELQKPAEVAKPNEISKKYKISEEVESLFEILKTLTLLQDDRKMFNAQVSYYINFVLAKKISAAFSITFEEARYLDKDAIHMHSSDLALFDKMMKERMDFFTVEQTDGKYIPHSGDNARAYLDSLGIKLNSATSEAKEIKGQVAYRGKVTGRVRVLKTSHVSDFADGDIIVTGMTTPDFAQLIKKASAIITNEGGITCHAAIISRELKKPCIIGTKIATQVLKDGDIVEVDAEKGIITILTPNGK